MDENVKKMLKDIPPEKLDDIIKMAGSKLGIDPEKIKNELNKATVSDDVLEKAKGVSPAQIKAALNDPKTLDALMKNPKGRKLIEDLLGGGKNG